MNLVVVVTEPETFTCTFPVGVKPSIILRPQVLCGDIWRSAENIQKYIEWLRVQIKDAASKKLYSMAVFPLNALNRIPTTDAEVVELIGGDEAKKGVWAIYPTLGPLSRSEYWLRLYGLKRQGLTCELFVEPKKDDDAGLHFDEVNAFARGIYYEEGTKPFQTFPNENCYQIKSAFGLLAVIPRFRKYKGIIAVPQSNWTEHKKIWLKLMNLAS